MSSQIPPLFCHTPPPMDFDDDEEDDVPDPDEDDFDDFASVPAASVNTDLPTPVSSPFPGFATPSSSPVKKHIAHKQDEILPQPVIENALDDLEVDPPRIESPPSLILSQHIYSENDLPSEDELQDYAFNPQEGDQKDTSVGPSEAEDNISIPSLQLDTEVSKSATPVHMSENEASERNLSPQEPTPEDLGPDPIQEAVVTPVVAEDMCCRFDDNTENDFTDFTTASNERSAVLEVPTANDVSFDDDFALLESTPSADSNFVSQSKTDFATFDADFSKFDSFPASFPATFDEVGCAPKDISTRQQNGSEEKTSPDAPNEHDLSQDDFDDFQDFAKFSADGSPAKTIEVVTFPIGPEESACEYKDDEENSDDFGEFSDFKQSDGVPAPVISIPTSRSVQFTVESILSVIIGMFPSCAEEAQSDTGQVMGSDSLQNELYHELRDMDSTKALAFQYNSSDSSKTLVRALGIDSRNILFGPKWNSSMPRFAANLGFSPLEPLKPASNTTTPSNASNPPISIGGTKTETGTKYSSFSLDPLPQSTGSVGVPTGNVPAVHFDWNSSGLINPLDASHAHTLLLDLEQLEVMANLKDKINIDSSSSSCNA
ncbi:aftiphilin-like, partial [Topomyia yanbarensis]|uniref:aftiphilin-like n=1 Tax=Topomyia yanbarensis TaxID=2498891 RepID=UPI00273C3551